MEALYGYGIYAITLFTMCGIYAVFALPCGAVPGRLVERSDRRAIGERCKSGQPASGLRRLSDFGAAKSQPA